MAKSARKNGSGPQKALTFTAIVVVAAAALTAGAIFGVGYVWRRIAARPEFKVLPADVALDAKWVRVEAMKKDFLRTAPRDKKGHTILSGPVSIFERGLAENVARAYRPSPWVRGVESVRKEFPNRLEVRLDLQLPYAVIKCGGSHICVSDDGVVLDPNLYKLTPDQTAGLRPVVEVPADTKRPVTRQVWDAPAVTGGIAMLRLCRGPLSKLPISLISIEAQKTTASGPPVCMAWLTLGADAAKGLLIQWGRITDGGPDSNYEAPAPIKVNSLLSVVAREGQNIWRFKQIDVRDAQVRCEE